MLQICVLAGLLVALGAGPQARAAPPAPTARTALEPILPTITPDAEGWTRLPGAPDYAPSGMPDFDQRRPAWRSPVEDESRPRTFTHDGPVGAAAALWWLDSIADPGVFTPPAVWDRHGLVRAYGYWDDHDAANVVPLVQDLARRANTNGAAGLSPPYYGTCAQDLVSALDGYFQEADTPARYRVDLLEHPDAEDLEQALAAGRGVLLLLGLWQTYLPGDWARIGGHYVALQAADAEVDRILIADPWRDEHGPVLPPGVRDDARLTSHDAWLVTPSLRPGPPVLRVDGYMDDGEELIANFQNHNRGHCYEPDARWAPSAHVEADVDLAIVLIPPPIPPSPTPTPTASPSPTPRPSATPLPSASPTPTRWREHRTPQPSDTPAGPTAAPTTPIPALPGTGTSTSEAPGATAMATGTQTAMATGTQAATATGTQAATASADPPGRGTPSDPPPGMPGTPGTPGTPDAPDPGGTVTPSTPGAGATASPSPGPDGTATAPPASTEAPPAPATPTAPATTEPGAGTPGAPGATADPAGTATPAGGTPSSTPLSPATSAAPPSGTEAPSPSATAPAISTPPAGPTEPTRPPGTASPVAPGSPSPGATRTATLAPGNPAARLGPAPAYLPLVILRRP